MTFCVNCMKKTNEIVNKFLLAGDQFMPEMHLRQPAALGRPGFICSTCGPFTKNKERIQKFKETGDTNYIYKNELDKACFQHDLERRTASDKILRDKAFDIARNPKYDGYQRRLASIVYKFFDKKSAGSSVNTHVKNDKLAEELHKPIIKIFLKRTVCCGSKNNIRGADLADMQLISKFNK